MSKKYGKTIYIIKLLAMFANCGSHVFPIYKRISAEPSDQFILRKNWKKHMCLGA